MATTANAPTTITGRQRLIVLLLLGAQFMLSVDYSILNVALPRVGAGVGLGLSALPWILTAYALPAAGFTLLFGRIADLFGRRRMFLIGITLLAAASLIGGFATNPVELLTARTLQGFATAIATPAALSLLVTSFSDESQRARVLGLNGALLSGGFTVGALVGGTLVTGLSWRWALLINVPVALVILAVTPFVVSPSRASTGVKLDVPGAITVTLGLLSFSFGVVNHNVYALIAGVLLLVVFWLIERKAPAPLAAVSILNRPTVKWGNLAGLIVFSMESGLIFLMTLYLQDVLHFSALTTGLLFGVPGLASVVAGIIAGRFIGRYGPARVLTVGLIVQTGFTAPLMVLGPSTLWLWVLMPALFIGFFGHVTAIASFMVTATTGLPDSEQGLATGLATLTQQIGITVGIPVLSAIAAGQAVLLTGIHLAVAANVAITVTVIVLISLGLLRRAPAVVGSIESTELAG
ncbi:MFS transporter [Nocardia terpenica]|uniref:MFS transporter n=1 Tax=Nocardia terpenica TaxID=455432 RepID=UPI001895F946|nr:MFS transporter [Nocardia terpenica]MBF6064116.1 MFS transporter [Nocardia terpenica]MBF6106449.1 MFS transporter [Nocardia terpenica]MBF6113734.1 MFS transporter [Nocardia terpenica]MBF6120642.1 MFS transporter [Nocardia terpenica]MBF6154701.1 MFS transporter [Nocardia terpenica]